MAQHRILARFHFALCPEGVLFLGKAEMLFTHSQLFAPIDLRRRVFKKITKDGWRERMAVMTQAVDDDTNGGGPNGPIHSAVFDAAPHAQLAIDHSYALAMFNESPSRISSCRTGRWSSGR